MIDHKITKRPQNSSMGNILEGFCRVTTLSDGLEELQLLCLILDLCIDSSLTRTIGLLCGPLQLPHLSLL